MNTAFSGLQTPGMMNTMGDSMQDPLKVRDQNAMSPTDDKDEFKGVGDRSKRIGKPDDRDCKMSSFLARRRKGLGKSGKLTKGGLDLQSFYKTKICPFLLAGHCSKAEKCSYAHSQTELKDVPNLKKTKICQQFALGKCQMGQRCSYAHGDTELRFTPEFYKTSTCSAFQKGNCIMGDKCRYAHGDVEIRQSSIFDQPPIFGRGHGFSQFNEMGFNMDDLQPEIQPNQQISIEKKQQITQSFNPVNMKDLLL